MKATLHRLFRMFAEGAKRDRFPIGIALAIWIVCALLLSSKGVNPIRTGSISNNISMYSLVIAGLLLAKVVVVVASYRPAYPIQFVYSRLLEDNWPYRLVTNVPMLIALAIFMPIFSAMKSAIPLFTDFDWDQTLMAWDTAIHGTDPWRILQPLLGHPPITFALSLLYQVWLLLIYFGSIFVCFFARDERLRQRYFISYFLIWSLLGIAAAQYFASIGPCFMLILNGDPSFTELMGYLHEVDSDLPLVSLRVQEILIRAYYVKNYELGSGITAMPSMHVALAFLFAFAMLKQNKLLGWVFMAYAFVILVGSVQLGFHYAIDGYFSIAGTLAIWWFSGKIAEFTTKTVPAHPVTDADKRHTH